MDQALSRLKIDENRKNELFRCKNTDELAESLIAIEKSIDDEIDKFQNQVDGQKLLDELHKYNEMKDMAQALIGSLANMQGVTVTEIHKDLNLEIT